jgi:hypothetical protein
MDSYGYPKTFYNTKKINPSIRSPVSTTELLEGLALNLVRPFLIEIYPMNFVLVSLDQSELLCVRV